MEVCHDGSTDRRSEPVVYGLNYLIDIAHAIIVDVEPTPARTYDEVVLKAAYVERRVIEGASPRYVITDVGRKALDTAMARR